MRPFILPEEQWSIVNFSTGPLVDKDTGVEMPRMHQFLPSDAMHPRY